MTGIVETNAERNGNYIPDYTSCVLRVKPRKKWRYMEETRS